MRAFPSLVIETSGRARLGAEDAASPAERRSTASELAAMSDVQQSQVGMATTVFCVVAGTIVEQFGPYLVTLCMAGGALLGGVSTLLSSLSALKTQEQSRRHAEERHRAEMVRLTKGQAEGGSV